MDKLKLLKEIELKYPVEEIKVWGIPVWGYVRDLYGHALAGSIVKKGGYRLLLSKVGYIFYGIGNLFKYRDVLILYSYPKNRVFINGKWYDRLFEKIYEYLPRSLGLEVPFVKHKPFRLLANKQNIYSGYLLMLLEIILRNLLINIRIENEWIFREIEQKYNVKLNYKRLIKRHLVRYLLGKFLARKFKCLIISNNFTAGYVKAFKEKNKLVIELQHGVISENHPYYNLFKVTDSFQLPDYLLTFGKIEKKVFERDDNFYIKPENVVPVGNFYLEYLFNNFKPISELENLKRGFTKSVCVSGQIAVEEETLPFLNKAASLTPEVIYLYVPRTFPLKYKGELARNIVIIDNFSIYEVIMSTDIHTTVFSTTSIEAAALNKPNVFINIRGLSKRYFGEILHPATAIYCENVEQYTDAIRNASFPENIRQLNSDVIVPNYEQNLKRFLKDVGLL